MDVRENVGTSSNSLLAGLAVPDADRVALDSDLAAECAGVLGVLRDFNLLHLLAERGTIAGTVLAYCARSVMCRWVYGVCEIAQSKFDGVCVRREGEAELHQDRLTGDADLLRSFRHCVG